MAERLAHAGSPSLPGEDARDFCIKSGYRPNLAPGKEGASADEYWNERRAAGSFDYQYDVYRLCRDLIRSRGCARVLDVGCGVAEKARELLAPLAREVVLVDRPSTRPLAERAFPGARFCGVDLERADADLGCRFPLVVCADVIEHLLDPRPCVRFIRRHLSPDGVAVLSTPERDLLRGADCNESGHPEHVREWNRREFAAFLRSAGLRVEQQLDLPPRRLGALGYAARRALSRWLPRPEWLACQVAICRAADARER